MNQDDELRATRKPQIPTFFHQDCTVCGRPLRVRIEYLGRRIACRHCGHRMTAADESVHRSRHDDQISRALRRADQWLAAEQTVGGS